MTSGNAEGLTELAGRLRAFAAERDWEQFHTPKNLAMALAAEMGELLEPFQWLSPAQSSAVMDEPGRAEAVRDELADVLIYLVRLADVLGVDLLDAAEDKVRGNAERYPPEVARGSAAKYTALGRTVTADGQPSGPAAGAFAAGSESVPPDAEAEPARAGREAPTAVGDEAAAEGHPASGSGAAPGSVSGSTAAGVAGFAFELGVLKRLRRAGWWQAGVRDPESVAEHSLRVAQLAGLLAALEGADPERAAYLAVWHDSQETRTGDIPRSGDRYLQQVPPERITADQTAGLPDTAAATVQRAVAEYEAAATPEARCARDADKLEMLLQAVEYRDAGYQQVQPFVDSARTALRTAAARRIAHAALVTSPTAWQAL